MKYTLIIILSGLLLINTGCRQKTVEEVEENFDKVHNNMISGVRLGDGVPLNLSINVRWKIENVKIFEKQFQSVDNFNELILKPRMKELISNVSYEFESVDSVFSNQRQDYIDEVKDKLLNRLGEESVNIKEVILVDILFPKTYTDAMEKKGLQQQELERIRIQNVMDLEKSNANRKRAEADGKVAIAQAEAQGRLEKIQAKTEESRRSIELARAETAKQVSKKRSEAEAERKRIMAKADLAQQEDIKNLEVQKVRDLARAELDHKKQLVALEFDEQMKMANLCKENPTYASFIVNRELAAKVDIAILPTGSDPTVFTDVINHRMPSITDPH